MKKSSLVKIPQQNEIRKTFKKLYEQKDLVRNTKDQYGVICDDIWKKSYRRLILKVSESAPYGSPKEALLSRMGHSNTPCSEPKVSEGKTKDFSQTNTLDFFDIKPNKKIIQSKNRQYIGIKSTTSYDKSWINNWKVDSSFGEKIGSLSYDQSNIQSIQIQSKRKHNTKLLPREHSQKLYNGRSVVNIALEQYSNRTKIKTLNDYFIEGNWAA